MRAAGLLRESDLKLAAITDRIGYQSEFASAKAFQTRLRRRPGGYRRQLAA